MNKWLSLTAFLLATLIMCGCHSTPTKLDGSWTLSGTQSPVFHFSADGSFTITSVQMEAITTVINGNYSLTDTDLSMTPTNLDVTTTDRKYQPMVDEKLKDSRDEKRPTVTRTIKWKSDNEFILGAESGPGSVGEQHFIRKPGTPLS